MTTAGVAYTIVGASGAAILSVVWPEAVARYPSLTPEEQLIAVAQFEGFTQMVHGGLWNLMDGITGGVWFLSVGMFFKSQSKLYEYWAIAIGIFLLLDSIGNMLQISLVSEIALNLYLILVPLWAIALGLHIARNKWVV